MLKPYPSKMESFFGFQQYTTQLWQSNFITKSRTLKYPGCNVISARNFPSFGFSSSSSSCTSSCSSCHFDLEGGDPLLQVTMATWWLIPLSKWVITCYNPSYKWINPTYPIYNWGYNALTSRGMSHQVELNGG